MEIPRYACPAGRKLSVTNSGLEEDRFPPDGEFNEMGLHNSSEDEPNENRWEQRVCPTEGQAPCVIVLGRYRSEALCCESLAARLAERFGVAERVEANIYDDPDR